MRHRTHAITLGRLDMRRTPLAYDMPDLELPQP